VGTGPAVRGCGSGDRAGRGGTRRAGRARRPGPGRGGTPGAINLIGDIFEKGAAGAIARSVSHLPAGAPAPEPRAAERLVVEGNGLGTNLPKLGDQAAEGAAARLAAAQPGHRDQAAAAG
jgi:hypothetical protein